MCVVAEWIYAQEKALGFTCLFPLSDDFEGQCINLHNYRK
ncbi:hypothetical protein A6A12_2792 [Vibrio anguillarum]|nr:hypothetical protein A6A12_2792 [Vibrio anguillarum]